MGISGQGTMCTREMTVCLSSQAVRKLLPTEQLPACALKQSWHLDKQSLRGIKRRREAEQEAEAAAQQQESQGANCSS